jgi:hypothetical protein
MEEPHEHKEYRKNPKTNFTLSAMRIMINQISSKEMGGQ